MKMMTRILRRLRAVWRFGGPPISDAVYQMLWSVRSPRERAALRRQPLQAHARLEWVAKDRGVSASRIVSEIAGAKTAIGVILESARGPCLATRLVQTR